MSNPLTVTDYAAHREWFLQLLADLRAGNVTHFKGFGVELIASADAQQGGVPENPNPPPPLKEMSDDDVLDARVSRSITRMRDRMGVRG